MKEIQGQALERFLKEELKSSEKFFSFVRTQEETTVSLMQAKQALLHEVEGKLDLKAFL